MSNEQQSSGGAAVDSGKTPGQVLCEQLIEAGLISGPWSDFRAAFREKLEAAAQAVRAMPGRDDAAKTNADRLAEHGWVDTGYHDTPSGSRRHVWLKPEDVRRTFEAIYQLHSQHADDLCWMPADVNRIFEAAGLPPQDLRVGDKAAMLRNCERYIECLHTGGPWKSYAELEAELAAATQRAEAAEKMCDGRLLQINNLSEVAKEQQQLAEALQQELAAAKANLMAFESGQSLDGYWNKKHYQLWQAAQQQLRDLVAALTEGGTASIASAVRFNWPTTRWPRLEAALAAEGTNGEQP